MLQLLLSLIRLQCVRYDIWETGQPVYVVYLTMGGHPVALASTVTWCTSNHFFRTSDTAWAALCFLLYALCLLFHVLYLLHLLWSQPPPPPPPPPAADPLAAHMHGAGTHAVDCPLSSVLCQHPQGFPAMSLDASLGTHTLHPVTICPASSLNLLILT